MELKSNLPSAAEETAENLLTKKYNVTDKNQLEADFLETLAYAIDSDSDIRLKINAADTEKQLLSVSVKEEFKHPNGKDGTMSYDRTVIVNKLKEGTGSLVLGTVQVADYVKAHDYNGQELAVKLLKFCDSDGNELPDQMDAAAGKITFESAGTYSFTVKATDSGNRKTTAVIHVPVM